MHQPRIELAAGAAVDALHKAEYLATMAERRCMVSNALRGNVEIEVRPELLRAPQADGRCIAESRPDR